MDKILHDLKDPKLWELWYIPYNGGNAGFCPSTVVTYTLLESHSKAPLSSGVLKVIIIPKKQLKLQFLLGV